MAEAFLLSFPPQNTNHYSGLNHRIIKFQKHLKSAIAQLLLILPIDNVPNRTLLKTFLARAAWLFYCARTTPASFENWYACFQMSSLRSTRNRLMSFCNNCYQERIITLNRASSVSLNILINDLDVRLSLVCPIKKPDYC